MKMKGPAWFKKYDGSHIVINMEDKDAEPFNLFDLGQWETEGRAKTFVGLLVETEVDAFLEWYSLSHPVNDEEKADGALVRAMLIDYLQYKLGFPTHIPDSQLLSKKSIDAIEQVLTVNRDIYNLLKKRGVTDADVRILCRMAKGEE